MVHHCGPRWFWCVGCVDSWGFDAVWSCKGWVVEVRYLGRGRRGYESLGTASDPAEVHALRRIFWLNVRRSFPTICCIQVSKELIEPFGGVKSISPVSPIPPHW
ncbi:unnamed protein product [Brugia pahangi]|uniref:Secreted protein n=1 Tax=Brugia pahangi TaxID=6280 RepID=A0A0N4T0Q2_BRUPA|nr:unnamed protein product [Brugia pahangi]